jgi:hypothetical protein
MLSEMEKQLEFTLIVQPHRGWGSFYHIWPDGDVIRVFTASGADYPSGTSMDWDLHEDVEYEETTMSRAAYEDILRLWGRVSLLTVADVLTIAPGLGFGGTIFRLKVESDTMLMTFEWRQLHGHPTPFDDFVMRIKEKP